jgi:multicomponent Na+:H+ antiporter subunit A
MGGTLFWARRPVGSVISRGIGLPSGSDAYLAALRALNRTASRLTGLVQNGSLPIYTAVILLTAAILPVAAIVIAGAWPAWPGLVDAPAHVPVAALIVGSAIAAATNRRRVSAVLFLGLTGYAMAALFVIQGAPDLALTTVAIETLTTVLFVLVLRHLPVRFEAKASRQRRVLRLAAATTMGTAVFVLALMAGGHPPTDPVSDQMVERSLPDGHGRNVVNVILVDFRGFDTMGEIAVLAAAGIGAVALARAGRRPPAEEAP